MQQTQLVKCSQHRTREHDGLAAAQRQTGGVNSGRQVIQKTTSVSLPHCWPHRTLTCWTWSFLPPSQIGKICFAFPSGHLGMLQLALFRWRSYEDLLLVMRPSRVPVSAAHRLPGGHQMQKAEEHRSVYKSDLLFDSPPSGIFNNTNLLSLPLLCNIRAYL